MKYDAPKRSRPVTGSRPGEKSLRIRISTPPRDNTQASRCMIYFLSSAPAARVVVLGFKLQGLPRRNAGRDYDAARSRAERAPQRTAIPAPQTSTLGGASLLMTCDIRSSYAPPQYTHGAVHERDEAPTYSRRSATTRIEGKLPVFTTSYACGGAA